MLAVAALQAQPNKPVEATWNSLAAHEVPAWLEDAKFGIYAHWGVYSVPAFGTEWYGRRMYDPKDVFGTYQHHRKTYGTQDATRTSSLCSKQRSSTRQSGPPSFSSPARVTPARPWFTTTASCCGAAR
jgi:hypothetical protein